MAFTATSVVAIARAEGAPPPLPRKKLVTVDGRLSMSSRNSIWVGHIDGHDGQKVAIKRFSSDRRCRTEMRALEMMMQSGMPESLYCGLAGNFGRALEDDEIAWIGDAAPKPGGGNGHPQSLILQLIDTSDSCSAFSYPARRYYPSDRWLLEMMGDAFRALDHMHNSAGLIHADVKPDNFARDAATGQLKLIDFDFSVPINDGGAVRRWVGGTPLYMPPEAFLEKNVTTASDAWALGIMLYSIAHTERVTHPFLYHDTDLESLSRDQLARRMLTMEYLPAMWGNQTAPLAADLASRLLARSPADRISLADAVKHPFFSDGADKDPSQSYRPPRPR